MCNGKIYTNLQGNKIPEKEVRCACLSLILLEPVFKVGKNISHKYFQRNVNML